MDFLSVLNKLKESWLDQETRCRKEAREILPKLRDIAMDGQFGPSGTTIPTPAAGPAAPSDDDKKAAAPEDGLLVDLTSIRSRRRYRRSLPPSTRKTEDGGPARNFQRRRSSRFCSG